MAVLNSTSRRAIYTSDHLKYSGGDSPIFHPLPSFVDMDSRVSWLTTINLAGVLPHEGMLPVGQLSFPLFFAWLFQTFAGMPVASRNRPRIISFARSARQAWTLRWNVRSCAFPA